MAPRKKARGRDPLLEPGLETATRRPRKVKKPAPSARPRSEEAKAARMATSRGASEAQAAAGPRRSRSAEATAARRSEARRIAAGTGRNRAFEASVSTRTPTGSTPYDMLGGIPPRVLRRPIDAPYDMLGGPAPGVPRRRSPTPFTPYDELGNQIPARRRTPSTAFDILGGTQDQASIERARLRAWEAEMRRLGHGSRFL
jgi:hypothetical protein